MSKKTLSITGQGSYFMKPDICNITFTVNKYNVSYGDCVNELNEEVNKILYKLKKINIDKDSLSTKDFDIRPYNIYNEDLKKYVFVEYTGEHKINIKVDNDSDLINKVLTLLNKNEFTPKVNISFGLKDENLIKEKALELAIDKAKKNAKIIATSLDVKLIGILDIKYNCEEEYTPRGGYRYLEEMDICESNCDFNIMPEDTRHSKSVSIVWEIGN